MKKILCFGSLNLDYVYSVNHIVRLGETESCDDMRLNCGGKGLNQSVALAKAGASVWHAGMVGEEGRILIDRCAENGVHTEYIRMVEGRSGHTIIQVDKDGGNSILLFGGANQCMTPDYIDEVLSGFDKGDMIVLQNEINLLNVIVDKAYEKGMEIVLNPSPYNGKLEECDLEKVSFFLLNEIEGEQMTGESDPDRILQKIRGRYPNAKAVLTLGEAGAACMDKEDIIRQTSYKVKAVDTTAAGDTFTGYFLASLIGGKEPKECLDLAARASAIAVTRHGALDSIPTMDEVRGFVI